MASRDNEGRWLEINTTRAEPNTATGATSPTSSQGSWVVDPDEGWDGLGAHPAPPSPAVPPQHQHQERQQERQQVSPTSSPLRSWARVPLSPPAAEYPTTMSTNTNSPPLSPCSVRSVRSASSGGSGGSSSSGRAATAGEGLVALARDENSDDAALTLTSLMDVSDAAAPTAIGSQSPSAVAAMVPRSLPFETFEALEGQGFQGAWAGAAGGGRGTAVVGYTTADDANAMDTDVADFAEPAEGSFVMTAAPGMTAAEAVEAIAEAAELRGITPASVVLSRTAVSPPPSSLSSGAPPPSEDGKGAEQEIMFRQCQSPSSYQSRTLPRHASPSASITGGTNRPSGTAGAARVGSDTAIASPQAVPVPSGAGGTCIPMDATVGIDVDVDVDVDVDGRYDGKHMDRLWRWTGLITAAKMGVIPIIVCATVAALSTQTSGGGDRSDRGGGGGGGGGAGGGGGGGGTRCSSRRRPRGGGGGGGCFPDVRMDRSFYGGMPMPYCVAPSVACA
ncbi:unnamed protein product [Pylaiella littoralis]